MTKRYDSVVTMFVYLKGHTALERHLEIGDARSAANDSVSPGPGRRLSAVSSYPPHEPRTTFPR
jgi:hypothetical protein